MKNVSPLLEKEKKNLELIIYCYPPIFLKLQLEDKHFKNELEGEMRKKIEALIEEQDPQNQYMHNINEKMSLDEVIRKYIPENKYTFDLLYDIIEDTFIKIGKKRLNNKARSEKNKLKNLNKKYFSLLEEENNKAALKKVTTAINSILKNTNKKKETQRLINMLENNEDPGTNLFKLLKNQKDEVNIRELKTEKETIHNPEKINTEFLKNFKDKFAENTKIENTRMS